jgi:hypothetical protein
MCKIFSLLPSKKPVTRENWDELSEKIVVTQTNLGSIWYIFGRLRLKRHKYIILYFFVCIKLCSKMRNSRHGLLYIWTELLYLTFPHEADLLTLMMSHTHSLNICKTLKKHFFRHAKGNSMVNFYIINALGQILANSESCPILRL